MKKTLGALTLSQIAATPVAPALPPAARTLRYVGPVTRERNERVLKEMEKLLAKDPAAEIGLVVTSPGGATGAAMSFFDIVRHVLKPRLVTIGAGDVDSSGIVIFLAGARRYLTPRTTMLLHLAGRVFGSQRYTAAEMASMLAEDRLKDEHYAALLAERSGALSREEVLALMSAQTVLAPERALALGFADALLG
jgi:ATP-dependent Clp protease protease subunit